METVLWVFQYLVVGLGVLNVLIFFWVNLIHPILYPNEREAILDVLSDGKERPGIEIAKESDGRVSPSAVYGHLIRMTEEGLLSCRMEQTNRKHPRRLYRITRSGRGRLTEYRERQARDSRGVPA